MESDHIYIRGLRVMGLIGVLPAERLAPQPLQIDVDLEVDLVLPGVTDDLNDTANYGAIADAIAVLVRASSDILLERLIARIADCVLSFNHVLVAHVTLTKLHPPIDEDIDSTAISISRSRQATDSATRHRAIVALGTNMGDRVGHLRFALDHIPHVVASSQVFETDPVGGPQNQDAYLNMVIEIDTMLDPYALLRLLNNIEAQSNRERIVRWGPRTLDLDILFYDNISIDDETLTIPHPRLRERRFVLQPLSEIAPDLCPAEWNTTVPAGVVHARGLLRNLISTTEH
ncbi:MAG: 2-amino-4-hydroxy-6-hydroxymethyldihydropteridine diphosphokinase [Ilumatobacteraceae bacterium]|nr:2-amino-4-hydroxy-6-hydroxymethyldihydropteridine diphosphokinase [Ilumatobacteraceae bacterium]